MPIDHMFAGWVQMSDKSYACEFDHIVAFCAVSIWNLAFVYVWKKKRKTFRFVSAKTNIRTTVHVETIESHKTKRNYGLSTSKTKTD